MSKLFVLTIFTYIYGRFNQSIGIMIRVLTDSLGDQGSIPGRIIPKTQKMVLGASLLNTHHYKTQIKCKGTNPGKAVSPSPIPLFSSY